MFLTERHRKERKVAQNFKFAVERWKVLEISSVWKNKLFS